MLDFKKGLFLALIFSMSSVIFAAVGINQSELNVALGVALGKGDDQLVNTLISLQSKKDDGILGRIQPAINYLWMALVAAIEQDNVSVFSAIVPKYINVTDVKPYGRTRCNVIDMVNFNKPLAIKSLLQEQESRFLEQKVQSRRMAHQLVSRFNTIKYPVFGPYRNTPHVIENLKQALYTYACTGSLDAEINATSASGQGASEQPSVVGITFKNALDKSDYGGIIQSLATMKEQVITTGKTKNVELISLLEDCIQFIKQIIN